jgi:hypothetical protein
MIFEKDHNQQDTFMLLQYLLPLTAFQNATRPFMALDNRPVGDNTSIFICFSINHYVNTTQFPSNDILYVYQ